MPHSHDKMQSKIATQKLKKAANSLASSSIVAHSNAASFSIKIILCENANILFSSNDWKLGKIKFKIKVRLGWTVFEILLTSVIICI